MAVKTTNKCYIRKVQYKLFTLRNGCHMLLSCTFVLPAFHSKAFGTY